jgi:hypothetical protein
MTSLGAKQSDGNCHNQSVIAMPKGVPKDHPLRGLFRKATAWSFRESPMPAEARDERVRWYLSESILAEFVHVDNLYRLRDARGRRLTDVAEMLMHGRPPMQENAPPELEINRHVGDYTLFITGIFPESLERLGRHKHQPDALLMSVGKIFVTFDHPQDYYRHQGKLAYSRAAQMGRRIGLEESEIFQRMSRNFEAYVNVMGLVRLFLDTQPAFAEAKKVIL